MGWFSKIWKKAKSVVKKVVKAVKKVAKKIYKGVEKAAKKVGKAVKKVGKKVWKAVKSVAKSISKSITKLGPLASIAIGFIPGFQGLWANAGIWGAIGKGAITGFITSGGKLKGALAGAAMGGIGYAAVQGASAFKGGMEAAGTNASISEQITQGFKAVGASTSQGVTNMYESASNLMTGGQGGLNYLKVDPLTGEMASIYGKTEADVFARMDGESVFHRANEGFIEKLPADAQDFMNKNKELFKTMTPKQVNEIFENQAGTSQLNKLANYDSYVSSEKLLAEQGGYTYDKYDIDSPIVPTADEYQSALDARGLDAQSTWDKVTGKPLDPNMMDVHYRGDLSYTEIDADTGEEVIRPSGFANVSAPKLPKTSSSAAKPAYEKYAIQTGQDIGKWSNTKALQGASQGRAGGGFDQMFDVRQLGLMRGTDMASLLAKQTYGLS